jgi:hypothetical protein
MLIRIQIRISLVTLEVIRLHSDAIRIRPSKLMRIHADSEHIRKTDCITHNMRPSVFLTHKTPELQN